MLSILSFDYQYEDILSFRKLVCNQVPEPLVFFFCPRLKYFFPRFNFQSAKFEKKTTQSWRFFKRHRFIKTTSQMLVHFLQIKNMTQISAYVSSFCKDATTSFTNFNSIININDRQWQKLKIASKVIVSNTKERSTNIGLKEMERNKVLTDVGIVLDHIVVSF